MQSEGKNLLGRPSHADPGQDLGMEVAVRFQLFTWLLGKTYWRLLNAK